MCDEFGITLGQSTPPSMSLALVASGTAVPEENPGPTCQSPGQPLAHLTVFQMYFSGIIASDALQITLLSLEHHNGSSVTFPRQSAKVFHKIGLSKIDYEGKKQKLRRNVLLTLCLNVSVSVFVCVYVSVFVCLFVFVYDCVSVCVCI